MLSASQVNDFGLVSEICNFIRFRVLTCVLYRAVQLHVKEFIAIKKINATINFNAAAIIATPKRQLLSQTTRHAYVGLQIVKIDSCFAQLSLLPNPQTAMLHNTFQSARHP